MAKLFGMGGDSGTTAAQTAQAVSQRRQAERVNEQEVEQGKEVGARRRLLAARSRGNSSTLFGAPAGVAATLGG